VDGILLADDVTQRHQKRAFAFIEAGVPTFCDKPLSRCPKEAEEIVTQARIAGTKFMSSSALRFSRELEEARPQLEGIGDILTVHAIGPNELIFYGVHPCELACTVLGPGAESVINVGDGSGHNVVRVRWSDGRLLVLQVCMGMGYGFEATFYGTKGRCLVQVSDAAYFYQNMLRAFVNLIETGEEAVPPEHTLEIIRILAAAERSLKEGREVAVNPAWKPDLRGGASDEAADACEGFLEVVHARGVGGADVALAGGAEHRAGHDGDALLLHQAAGEGL
jgi:predicted dehydrogenase